VTEVKICGITNREDALTAVHAGADAIGFIFYPASPRFVNPDRVRQIACGLPGSICRVGVFVDEDPEEVRRIRRFCGLDYIQLHGKESSDYCALFSPSVLIKAVSLRKEEDLAILGDYPVKAILVDTGGQGSLAGRARPAIGAWPRKREKGTESSWPGASPGEYPFSLETVSPKPLTWEAGWRKSRGRKTRQRCKPGGCGEGFCNPDRPPP